MNDGKACVKACSIRGKTKKKGLISNIQSRTEGTVDGCRRKHELTRQTSLNRLRERQQR